MLKKEQKWIENAKGSAKTFKWGKQIFRELCARYNTKNRATLDFLYLLKSFVPKSEKNVCSENLAP